MESRVKAKLEAAISLHKVDPNLALSATQTRLR